MTLLGIAVFGATIFFTLATFMNMIRKDGANALVSSIWTSVGWMACAALGGWFA